MAPYHDRRVEGQAAESEAGSPRGANMQRRVVVKVAILSLGLLVAAGTVRADEEKIAVMTGARA